MRVTLLLVLAALAAGLVLLLLRRPYTTEELRWTNGQVELVGTLYVPAGDGPHPAAVFLHGAGGWTREEKLFRVHAERMAASGLAMLIYDKRGCGASTGDWRGVTFADLATDAMGGVELLRADPRIDADAVGLFGTSQGGSVALLAASQSPEISFLVTLSMSPRQPVELERDLVRRRSLRDGPTEEEIAKVVELGRQMAPLDRAFDPGPLLEALRIPLFAAQGADDRIVPGPQAAEVLQALGRVEGRDFTVVLVPNTGHVIRQLAGWPIERWTWPDAYWQALESWLDEALPRSR